MRVSKVDLYHELFDQSWRFLSERFYDAKFHGADWDRVRRTYRPLVKHVAMKEDLSALLHLMMGELNASHLGVYGFLPSAEEDTAELGLLFDDGYRGEGLKIAEVLKGGPADRRGVNLKPGEVVVSIDGTRLGETANLSRLLNGKAGEAVLLELVDNPAAPRAKRRKVELTAVSRSEAATLMYDRWVARNAELVRKKSGGKLGYVHIRAVDGPGLDRFVRSLYSDNFDKKAIILDVRHSGAELAHDQALNYLDGRPQTTFEQRDPDSGVAAVLGSLGAPGRPHTIFLHRDGRQEVGMRASDLRLSKPGVLLINERSFGDAEILANAFRTVGLGKLVGEPTGGLVIGTEVVHLIDGSLFSIPRTGVYTTKGVNMDREGVRPDVLVGLQPDQLARGVDAQLEKAVEVLEADRRAWKRPRSD
jgi:tricorn protease